MSSSFSSVGAALSLRADMVTDMAAVGLSCPPRQMVQSSQTDN
jgi:hypothetical protein